MVVRADSGGHHQETTQAEGRSLRVAAPSLTIAPASCCTRSAKGHVRGSGLPTSPQEFGTKQNTAYCQGGWDAEADQGSGSAAVAVRDRGRRLRRLSKCW